MHTAFLDRFCTNIGLVPADHHAEFNVDYTYTYHFCMDRFSTLDQFLLIHVFSALMCSIM